MIESKVFKDPVHGYIPIDEDIVNKIIDNKYFQRLRRIEQTSMRCLYPSARHDRFSHSLGTYYLATIVSAVVKKNNGEESRDNTIKVLAFNFEMSALLHDVGHSPMSHTLEKYFDSERNRKCPENIHKVLTDKIKKLNEKGTFEADFKNVDHKPSQHEIVSCITILDCFKDALNKLCKEREVSADYEFIVRSITGVLYTNNKEPDFYTKNAFIKLLNSSAIDIDKLDYVKRDSFFSGYDTVSVDTSRLLNSLDWFEKDGNKMLGFGKSAISIVQNVVACRNLMNRWIFVHHKVVYETELLKSAVNEIIETEELENISGVRPSQLFSISGIEEHLVCDDDIWVMLKSHQKINEVSELLDRSKHKTSLWKTSIEFNLLFRNSGKSYDKFDVDSMINTIDFGGKNYEDFLQYIDQKFSKDINSCHNIAMFIRPKINIYTITDDEIYIVKDGIGHKYSDDIESIKDKPRSIDFLYDLYAYIDSRISDKDKALLSVNKNEFIKKFTTYIEKYDVYRSQQPKDKPLSIDFLHDLYTYIDRLIPDEDKALLSTNEKFINKFATYIKEYCDDFKNRQSFVYAYVDSDMLTDEYRHLLGDNKKEFIEKFVTYIEEYDFKRH